MPPYLEGRFASRPRLRPHRRSSACRDGAIETLRGEDAEFGFGQVEP
jgi:hypothetical protein